LGRGFGGLDRERGERDEERECACHGMGQLAWCVLA
jgi:hypothetical protein